LLGLSFTNFAAAAIITCGQASAVEPLPQNPTPEQTAAYHAAIAANECKLSDLILTIERIINFLLSWAWIICIFYIMWAGYNMIAAGGNSEALQDAKTQLRNAIVGFFLIMAAYLIINWIVAIFSTGQAGPGAFDMFKNLIRP